MLIVANGLVLTLQVPKYVRMCVCVRVFQWICKSFVKYNIRTIHGTDPKFG